MSTGRKISLIEEDDGGWSAIDEEAGVASQGETREAALANLDEAVELTKGEIGELIDTPEEERAAPQEMGIDPDEIEASREENDELPDFMR